MKNFMLATTALAVCLTSCNKDDENRQATDDLNASISITIPRITTYATDLNAVGYEAEFVTADIFIYDGTTLETYKRLDGATDFQLTATDNAYESITPIQTTTGPKEVYVGLNLPASIVNTIRNSGIKAGLALATQLSVSDLVDDGTGTKGFAMFSKAGVSSTFVEDDTDPANTVSVTVERLVAKITVEEVAGGVPTAVTGGTISNLQFAMRNSNKYIYALQQKDGSGNILDPNWNSYVTSAASTDFESFTNYVAVNASGDPLANLNNKYAPENTSQNHASEESTYASLRVSFAPTTFTDGTGAPKGSPATWTAGDDFWTIVLTDGTLNYFEDETEADTYRAAHSGAAKNKYENGYCYYNMFLNPTDGYNTHRNTYYKLTINSITGLGNPNPEDGGNTPNPVPSATEINVDIDIAAWTLVADGYDL